MTGRSMYLTRIWRNSQSIAQRARVTNNSHIHRECNWYSVGDEALESRTRFLKHRTYRMQAKPRWR